MLNISYKLKGLPFKELWFASKVPVSSQTLLALYCYRGSRLDTNKIGLKKESKYTLVNDLTLAKDELFLKFKSNVRNEIRKCDKIENFRYHFDETSKEQFLDFYTNFSTAKSLPNITRESLDKYGENLLFISGYLDEQLTNMQLYLFDEEEGLVRLMFSISTLHEVESKTTRAKIGWVNRFLHWQVMLHFKSRSFKVFDWGGYGNGSDEAFAGIDKFKDSFGGDKVKVFDYYTYPYFFMKYIQGKLL